MGLLKPWFTVAKESTLGGGFKHLLFSPGSLGRWSNLTSIFFKWIGSTTNQTTILLMDLEIRLHGINLLPMFREDSNIHIASIVLSPICYIQTPFFARSYVCILLCVYYIYILYVSYAPSTLRSTGSHRWRPHTSQSSRTLSLPWTITTPRSPMQNGRRRGNLAVKKRRMLVDDGGWWKKSWKKHPLIMENIYIYHLSWGFCR